MSRTTEVLPSKTGWWRNKIRLGHSGRSRLLVGALLPALVLVIWQLLGQIGLISRLLFPTPLTIADSFIALIASGALWEHLRISMIRAAAGFALGGSLGLLFGIAVGLMRSVEKTLDPTVQMIRMIPHLAVAPLFVLWFGLGETSKILIIAKGAFFPIYINAFLGIRNVDNKLFEVAKVLSFSKLKQIIRLVIPAAMPNLLLGVRLSLGVAWLGLVVAELMGSTSGIGYLMSDARQFSRTSVVFVCIIIFALVGYLADALVRFLERRLLQWRDSFQGK
ncbi:MULTISPECIES: ABC transporter permease [Paenibacillus]|uniref:Sulfonate ABC transporter n=1 Tax=Paenibacillus naphthalenovorans TaxID=162209 RepID=A0A0U2KWP2_9BACL|nr:MULTISPECIES: ABC transporter permease [Paenibacillus]ALS21138.1 sulfonate ABC transporter [Paenibacillus naphthalenovorans]GCL71156.1 ABC transporter permease [Paenibacillus naphthalenovorans]SDI02047.1 sulfonate transport system permease protein [Paenibacillus naphthalenovorans]